MMINYILLLVIGAIMLMIVHLFYKSSKKCKATYINHVSELEKMLNSQISINNMIQDRLDYINVHILAMEDKIINIVRSKEEIYEGTKPMDSNIYTKPTLVAKSKSEEDFSFCTAKEKLSSKIKSTNKKSKITKIDVHKEIKKRAGIEWFVIRKMGGEEVYKEAYKKAYQRLYYKKNKK